MPWRDLGARSEGFAGHGQHSVSRHCAGIPIVGDRPGRLSADRDSCDLFVLGVLYESFIHPLTILSGLPSAAFGALFTLQIFGYGLDLYGFVGIIMLIGIVKKNAIMMVDFAIQLERSGHKTAAEAIYEGCLVRFRPIMMTTMAALMGTAPIAFGIGSGANSRRSLGLAVVGGLIFSQLVTLYLTPVFYTYMDTFQSWLERRSGMILGKRVPTLAEGSTSAD